VRKETFEILLGYSPKTSSAKSNTNEVYSSSDSEPDLDIYVPESKSVNVHGQDDESLEVQETRGEEGGLQDNDADNEASEHHDNGTSLLERASDSTGPTSMSEDPPPFATPSTENVSSAYSTTQSRTHSFPKN